ncbi:MAG: 50S ribosomal protein L3 [Chloroflexi bacterium]|nr:50S ribosomal protein L3 [Chloroflexota bacterium]
MVQGLIGKKLGMARIFQKDGAVVPVTVLQAGPCVVTQVKSAEKEGYGAAQLGFGETKKLTAAMKGHLKDLGKFRYLREFEAEDTAALKVGQVVDVSLFKEDDVVEVVGTSKGKGFAGVVKRHHFHGGPKTHGQSDRHRAPGSIGSTTYPGRVWKGQRMAGHLGNERVTQKNLKVVRVDAQKNLLLVRGAVPGAANGLVLISKVKASR